MFIAALLAVGTVACSSEPSPSVPAPSSSSAAEAANGEPTRKEGAAKYLEIVAPSNAELDKCLPVLNPLRTSGESKSRDFPKLRKACAGVPAANRKFADDLSRASWPAEAQKSVDQLVDELRAAQLAWEGVAKANNHDDLFDPKYPLPDDGTAAAMVRAHLGLPAVEDVEE
ncbi:hypothetical protein OG306_33295 [Streptomyces sp. NBC_01241]|uniref:hypothetical protein n=1 Tax=Streptomyces sp. NBC_01241 TaxID=2903794 RepID=UPI00352BD6F6|nr:hypothetical protein OG306_33295 [Streptomyces sp. NBC_01241]